MQEAGFSLTFKMLDEHGGDYLVTMRAETAEGWPLVLQERKKLVDMALAKGWTLAVGREQPTNGKSTSKPNVNNSDGSFKDFDATQIIKTFDDNGNLRIKVKGHPFEKFGVPVYEEDFSILGIDVDQLKPGAHEFSHRVRAVLKDDGNPRKIVEVLG